MCSWSANSCSCLSVTCSLLSFTNSYCHSFFPYLSLSYSHSYPFLVSTFLLFFLVVPFSFLISQLSLLLLSLLSISLPLQANAYGPNIKMEEIPSCRTNEFVLPAYLLCFETRRAPGREEWVSSPACPAGACPVAVTYLLNWPLTCPGKWDRWLSALTVISVEDVEELNPLFSFFFFPLPPGFFPYFHSWQKLAIVGRLPFKSTCM